MLANNIVNVISRKTKSIGKSLLSPDGFSRFNRKLYKLYGRRTARSCLMTAPNIELWSFLDATSRIESVRISRARQLTVSHPELLVSAAAMTVFSVHHKTTYRYKKPIGPGLHQLLFRPRDSFDQRLMDCRIEVVPEPAEVRWIHDVFGNCLTLVDFSEKCEFLEFETFTRSDCLDQCIDEAPNAPAPAA
jgi:transglutaminase superfamily protein